MLSAEALGQGMSVSFYTVLTYSRWQLLMDLMAQWNFTGWLRSPSSFTTLSSLFFTFLSLSVSVVLWRFFFLLDYPLLWLFPILAFQYIFLGSRFCRSYHLACTLYMVREKCVCDCLSCETVTAILLQFLFLSYLKYFVYFSRGNHTYFSGMNLLRFDPVLYALCFSLKLMRVFHIHSAEYLN